MGTDTDVYPQARIPADVDTPDKIVYGLTARQLAILAVAAVLGYGAVKVLAPIVAAPVLIAVLTPLAGATIVVALGRRDGVSMDQWLWAAIRHSRSPKRLTPTYPGRTRTLPGWAPDTTGAAAPVGVLKLPATAITESGVIDAGDRAVALVACTTVNIGLRTGDEQSALIGAYGRWLNSLAGPVQIVVSTQRVDLASHAHRIADTATTLADTNPALADAALDYALFLDDLALRRDPLCRTVTIAVTAQGERGRVTEVLRRADHTAAALAALGVQTAVLDGARATGVLTCAVDPYTPTATWPRARPDTVITMAGAPA